MIRVPRFVFIFWVLQKAFFNILNHISTEHVLLIIENSIIVWEYSLDFFIFYLFISIFFFHVSVILLWHLEKQGIYSTEQWRRLLWQLNVKTFTFKISICWLFKQLHVRLGCSWRNVQMFNCDASTVDYMRFVIRLLKSLLVRYLQVVLLKS